VGWKRVSEEVGGKEKYRGVHFSDHIVVFLLVSQLCAFLLVLFQTGVLLANDTFDGGELARLLLNAHLDDLRPFFVRFGRYR
jgi:hypothetical protein